MRNVDTKLAEAIRTNRDRLFEVHEAGVIFDDSFKIVPCDKEGHVRIVSVRSSFGPNDQTVFAPETWKALRAIYPIQDIGCSNTNWLHRFRDHLEFAYPEDAE